MRPLNYSELPPTIQKQADNYSEFLKAITKTSNVKGAPVYIFRFQDSNEEWFRYFDAQGQKIGHSPFYGKNRAKEI